MIVTGFGPFGPASHIAHEENPAELIARGVGAVGWESHILPVTFSGVQAVPEMLGTTDPVICIGVAADRKEPKLEKVAINWAQADINDNDGVIATGYRLDPDGPDGVFSPLDVESMAERANIGVSYSAGTFVCNALAYHMYRSRPAVFLHVPPVTHLSVADGIDLVLRLGEVWSTSS